MNNLLYEQLTEHEKDKMAKGIENYMKKERSKESIQEKAKEEIQKKYPDFKDRQKIQNTIYIKIQKELEK